MNVFLCLYYVTGSTLWLAALINNYDKFINHGPFFIFSFSLGLSFFILGFYVAFKALKGQGEMLGLFYQLPQIFSLANGLVFFRFYSGVFFTIAHYPGITYTTKGVMGSWHLYLIPPENFHYWHINVIAVALAALHFLRARKTSLKHRDPIPT
ncbi:hypothetical protein [Alcanivorax hongdengensis]|uniref:hypothetical protein n=1 Tax=Alcanivorax hongdengensis TaxID=519051 RepID=UPI0012FCEB01|nr:hypothetical protein [Alcanivorax hongdengensis]